jgi:hypothetical protein
VITRRALSINRNGPIFAIMSEEAKTEKQEAARIRYEVAKYTTIQRLRVH